MRPPPEPAPPPREAHRAAKLLQGVAPSVAAEMLRERMPSKPTTPRVQSLDSLSISVALAETSQPLSPPPITPMASQPTKGGSPTRWLLAPTRPSVLVQSNRKSRPSSLEVPAAVQQKIQMTSMASAAATAAEKTSAAPTRSTVPTWTPSPGVRPLDTGHEEAEVSATSQQAISGRIPTSSVSDSDSSAVPPPTIASAPLRLSLHEPKAAQARIANCFPPDSEVPLPLAQVRAAARPLTDANIDDLLKEMASDNRVWCHNGMVYRI